jgi:hypothetical protein
MATVTGGTSGRTRYLGPGQLTAQNDQTEPACFQGPNIAITITPVTWTGTLLWQKRPRPTDKQGGSNPSSPVPFFTVRTFVPGDFSANQPTVYVPNAGSDEEYQLVVPAGFGGGPVTVYIAGGQVQ